MKFCVPVRQEGEIVPGLPAGSPGAGSIVWPEVRGCGDIFSKQTQS